MEINLINTLNYPFENNSAALKELNQELKLNLDALNIHLISDDELLSINKEYLQHDYYTDIITFDLRDEWSNEAELFISVDRVKENAAKIDIDEETELRRVCIHGLLHLSGLKDKTKEEVEKMRLTENKYLDLLFHVKQA
jgi:probable rRNA maturation factor